jgi:hypothetical protein
LEKGAAGASLQGMSLDAGARQPITRDTQCA